MPFLASFWPETGLAMKGNGGRGQTGLEVGRLADRFISSSLEEAALLSALYGPKEAIGLFHDNGEVVGF